MLHSGHVKFHDSLQPLMTGIDEVQRHPDNFNNGAMEEIERSIEVNGMYRPIFTQASTGYIVAGNHTWEACKKMGAEMIPVVNLDLNDVEALQIMVADNEIARLARPDPAALLATLEQISEYGDLSATGKTTFDIEALRHLTEIENTYDEFAVWQQRTFSLPPHAWRAFDHLTREADDQRDSLELLLRLAGWDGQE